MASCHCILKAYDLFPIAGSDDELETVVNIHFRFVLGCDDYYDKTLGNYLPGDPDEVEFLDASVDILSTRVMLPKDDALYAWAEKYFEDNRDEAIGVGHVCMDLDNREYDG